jgi:hypothetical protein
MHIRSIAFAGALALSAVVALPAAAQASPDGTNCWGVVSSQAARSSGGLGEHASSFDEPRLGIGNVARLFGLAGPGELGSFLASVDGDPATSC